MQSLEVLTLIQLALGKASVAFMSQPGGGKIVMPTEELLETANELCEAIMALQRNDAAVPNREAWLEGLLDELRADRAALESQLAESEAKCAELEREIAVDEEVCEVHTRALATERAARAEAERLAVWAVKHGAYLDHDPQHESIVDPTVYHANGKLNMQADSTPAGILAALRQAEAKGAE